jgi:5'-methylthioadenosine phosphorylase
MTGQRKPVVGILGGSGVYELDGLANARWEKVESPFGAPSDELLFGELNGVSLVFLPRHGRGHRIPPSEVNYRANVDALKRAGVTDLLSLSACGSLREGLSPGTFVLVDQFIDRTFARARSFFESGLVAHVSMAHPVCRRLGEALEEAARQVGVPAVRGGGVGALPGLGLRRDRHDEHARGQARA